ncbi:MAG: hypothetical protein F4Y03_00230 [Alphaproteobacteria bacterium]|nr:hypothetical protein [Alphaproteobacteria bacterium]
MKGVAFKVNYNDGGAAGGIIGYRGVCSDRTILHNVKTKRPWCSNEGCRCRIYYENNFKTQRPRGNTCYERSLLVSPFRFGAGIYHQGPREGQPIPIQRVEPGDIAFLTTIPPGNSEHSRIIFGCYRVGEVTQDDDNGYFVVSDGQMDVRIPDDIARSLFYWSYQQPNNDGGIFWGTGLFRYIDETHTQNLLGAILWRLGDDSARDTLYNALGGNTKPRPPASGGGGRGGGESEAHKKLKEKVKRRPELVGLPRDSISYVEHRFLSGDQVDIKFDLPDGTAAVVEIETEIPLPGAHQVVKYRALLEVERGEDLNSGRVQAILVAHRFDEQTREIAEQYDIELFELRA